MKKATLLIMAVMMTMSASACTAKETQANTVKKDIAVTATSAEKRDIINEASFSGRVMPEGQTLLFSKMPGKVSAVYVAAGDTVKAGDLLFALDDSDIDVEVNQAASSLRVAEAAYDTQKEQLEAALSGAQKALDSTKEAFDSAEEGLGAGAITNAQYAEAKGAYETAKIQYDSALAASRSGVSSAQLNQAKTGYTSARSQLSYSKVYAPISGKLTMFTPKLYEMVGNTQPAAIIANDEAINCEFYVSQSFVTAIGTADIVYVEFANHAGTQTRVSAAVTEIATMPSENGLFTVKTILDYIDAPIGASIIVSVEIEKSKDAMTLPVDVVRYDVDGEYVYIIEDNAARKVSVETGLKTGERVEILSGITEKDKIISSWNTMLSDGVAVRVIE